MSNPTRDRLEAINAVAKRFGGWLLIMSGDYEPTEELIDEMEAAGLTREQFSGRRRYYGPDPKKKETEVIAVLLYLAWHRYVNQERGRDAELPSVTGKRWSETPFEYDFWQTVAKRMEEFHVSIGEVDNEIQSRPNRYKPLMSMWARALQDRRK